MSTVPITRRKTDPLSSAISVLAIQLEIFLP